MRKKSPTPLNHSQVIIFASLAPVFGAGQDSQESENRQLTPKRSLEQALGRAAVGILAWLARLTGSAGYT